jgi:hypothetical protein
MLKVVFFVIFFISSVSYSFEEKKIFANFYNKESSNNLLSAWLDYNNHYSSYKKEYKLDTSSPNTNIFFALLHDVKTFPVAYRKELYGRIKHALRHQSFSVKKAHFMSYILNIFYKRFGSKVESFKEQELFFRTKAPDSCSLKKHIRRYYTSVNKIEKALLVKVSDDSKVYSALLAERALNFPSKNFTLAAIEKIKKSQIKRSKLNKWLKKDFITLVKRIKSQTRNRLCTRSQNELKNYLLSNSRDYKSYRRVVALVFMIDRCYKRYSKKSSTYTLDSFYLFFKEKLSKKSRQLYELDIISYYINKDKLAQATLLVKKILNISDVKDNIWIKASSLYSKILRQKKQYVEAASNDVSIVEKFDYTKETEKIFRRLMLYYFDQKIYTKSINLGKKILIQKGSDTLNSKQFAYFWLALSYLKMNNSLKAASLFKKNYSLYPLSYYGVVSFLFTKPENIFFENKASTLIKEDDFKNIFSSEVEARVALIKRLLFLGDVSTASCEMQYFNTEMIQDSKQLLAISLLGYAVGSWLLSVKSLLKYVKKSNFAEVPKELLYVLFPLRYSAYVKEFSTKVSINEYLIYSLMRQESVFNKRAHSLAGARGLMQLMPATAKQELSKMSSKYLKRSTKKIYRKKLRSKRSLFDPKLNIALGVHYLQRINTRFNSMIWALAGYNAGPSKASKWKTELTDKSIFFAIEKIPYKETRNYIKFVMRNLFYYKNLYSDKKINKESVLSLLQTAKYSF